MAILLTFFCSLSGAWAGCKEGNCKNGPGIYAWPDGSNYTGDFLNGKFHGQGTYAWADGKKYTGGFKNDKRNGVGTYTWPNGSSYKGEWENGKKSGYGIYTFPDGRKRIGIWENDSLTQEMAEDEVLQLLSPKPGPGAPAAAAVAATAPAQSADSDLNQQLVALGGQPDTAAPSGEESLAAPEAAAAPPAKARTEPFVISVQKIPLVKGSRFNTWENVPLLAVGPITPVGTCSVKVAAQASDTAAGVVTVQIKIANQSGCPLDFKGFLQAGEYYVKVVSWSGGQAIAAGSEKEVSRTVTLDKSAPRSEIFFKLQGAGCRL